MTLCIQESPGRNQDSLNLVHIFWESLCVPTAVHQLLKELTHPVQRIVSSHAKDVDANLAARSAKILPTL